MNTRIRRALLKKIVEQIMPSKKDNLEEVNYSDCRKIAERLDCEPNSIARLFGISSFKPTQYLKPETEEKICLYLGFPDFDTLEFELMSEIVFEEFCLFMDNRKRKQ